MVLLAATYRGIGHNISAIASLTLPNFLSCVDPNVFHMSNPSKSHFLTAILLLLCALGASGCLTAERKEIVLRVKPDGSGTGTITFYNVGSIEEDGNDVSIRDYSELVSNYLKGTKFEDFYPDYINFRKRLYESDGELNGEVTFEFIHYEDIGLYRYQGNGPWMYHVGQRSDFAVETYDASNGTVPNTLMPVVFWPAETTEFHIVSKFDRSESTRSLLPLFRRIGAE